MYSINTPSDYSLPTELLSFGDFDIVPFLLYRAAPVRTTSLSYDLEHVLSVEVRSDLFNRFMVDSRDLFIFSSSLDKQIDRIADLGLADQNLLCDCDKGFCWVRQNPKNDIASDAKLFDALLVHLRNSFAHGRTSGDGDRLILEDQFNSKSKSNNLSARFVLEPSTLVEWVKAIEKAIIQTL